jgi:maleylacetoacetate isomerase
LPIIEYINETRKQEPNLIPTDPVKRARARAIAEIINSGIQPYQNTNVVKRIAQEMGDEKKNEWLQFYLRKGFKAIEEALKETSGKFCVGDEITIADLCLVPQGKYFFPF